MSSFRDFLKQLLNVQVVIDGVEYPNTYADDLSIDRTNLEEEFVEHSERYAYYATLAEMADDRADRLKEDLEHLAAKLDVQTREKAKNIQQQDPKFKMTETMVENEVKNSKAYQELQKEYQQARSLAKLMKTAPHAFAHRRDMLIELGKTAMSSVSDPRVQQGKQQMVKNIMGAQRRAPQLPAPGGEPEMETPYTGKHCVVCHQPQFTTDSGDTCSNGHGGACALEDASPEVLAANPGPDAILESPMESGRMSAANPPLSQAPRSDAPRRRAPRAAS